MNKYRNYVYLSICEISLVTFKKSGYVDYEKYCKSLFDSCKNGLLTRREKTDIIAITKRIELIYSMGGNETANYIIDYLRSDRVNEFKDYVVMSQELFPNSTDLNK